MTMSKVVRLSICVLGVLLLSTCSIERMLNGTTVVASPPPFPPDEVSYVPRSVAGTFEFKTLLPVNVNLAVRQYRFDETLNSPGSWTRLEPLAADVYVAVTDTQGTAVYAGKVPPDGNLSTRLLLPAAPEDLTFTLSSEGFIERSFTVKATSGYEELNRTVSMEAEAAQAKGIQASAVALPDRDGDSVPDAYDEFPDDPGIAFAINVPFDGPLTIAFEDLFDRAQAGDADYNDFIANYQTTEYTNGQENAIVRIDVTAKSVAKIAGYNHNFLIAIDSFTGGADLTIHYPTHTFTTRVRSPAVIPLFLSTRDTVGQQVSFSLHFDAPQPRETMDEPPYNPFLYVWNTGYDIHLIGEESLPGWKSYGRSFQDAEGFPWALLVPSTWKYPSECQRIEVHYPRFTLWRQSFGAAHTDWYLHYDDPYVVTPVVHVAGYYNTGAPGAKDVAAYWKDDAAGLVPLYDLNTAHATSVFVSGTDVYAAGFYKNSKGNRAAAYWKNGQLKDLYSDTTTIGHQAQANAIAVSGSNVYVAGWVDEGTKSAVVWKIDAAESMEKVVLYSADIAEAFGVTASGADVYVSGYYTSSDREVSCWWKNDAAGKKDLYTENYSEGLAIAVSGTDVYVAGYYMPVGGTATACYWKNNLAGQKELSTKGQATSVFVSGADVYVGGYYLNTQGNLAAAYWKNNAGGMMDLYSDTTGTNDAQVFSIFVADGVVYTAGQVNEGTQVACYWKGRSRTDLYPGGTSLASSIRVTAE
jgi:LruC domain-containing protein